MMNTMKVHPISSAEMWLAQITLFIAISLQIIVWAINPSLTYGPHNLIVVTELILAVVIGVTASQRHLRYSKLYRNISIGLIGLISFANIASFLLVSRQLLLENVVLSGRQLLIAAVAIFITNVIVFALWYWEIDSPGLSGSKWSRHDKDFQFTQQDMSRDFPEWQPGFAEYLYLSLTNAINFAPADARPLTHQAKTLMGIQSLMSVFTLALVFARSVSILN